VHVDIIGNPNTGSVTVVILDKSGKEHAFILPANNAGEGIITTHLRKDNGRRYGM